MKIAQPAYSLPVSNYEKQIAEKIRSDFKSMLQELDRLSRYLLVFFDNVDDLPSNEDLTSLTPLMKKYEVKLKNRFNSFTTKLEEGFAHYNDGFADTKLDNIRDLIIETTKVMREGVVSLLKAFNKVEDPEFLTEAKTAYELIDKNIQQLFFIVQEELFSHIDLDILGRIRLGISQVPLTIKEAKDGI